MGYGQVITGGNAGLGFEAAARFTLSLRSFKRLMIWHPLQMSMYGTARMNMGVIILALQQPMTRKLAAIDDVC